MIVRNWPTLLLSIALALLALGSTAHAQDVEKQVSRMNKKAMEDYDSLEFESARKTLIDAVAILRANGLDETPLAAKTFVNLGILYIAGFKDRARGQQQFVNALKIKADIKIDPAIATPELDEAFAAAQKAVGVGGRGVSKPPVEKPPVEKPPVEKPPVEKPPELPPEPPAEVKGLQHNPVDESRPNTPVPIRAQLGTDLGATRLYLFFRGSGQEDYASVPMKNTGGADWVGVIPGDAVSGRALQYYLEARDARNRPVVGSGSAANPYIIAINENAAAPTDVPQGIDVEDPLAAERARKRREEEERRGGKFHRFFIFASLGSGLGYVPAATSTEVAWQFQADPTGDINKAAYVREAVGSGGAVFAPLHVGVELGAFVARNFSLSLLGRFEVFTGANAETQTPPDQANGATHKATGAVAGMLRARYRFLSGRVHPYIHVDIGGGQIREILNIGPSNTNTDVGPLVDRSTATAYNGATDRRAGAHDTPSVPLQLVCPAGSADCYDTIVLGDFLVGGGVGLWIDVHKYLAFIVDANWLGAIGVGSGQTGMNIDVNLGFGAHF